ncbi:response regulator [Spirulina subsalsa FACHB-351]|uniref:Response regulator n=1 Tax=Spirulina subsalsa FACHB-351 TaxID=234711 RepID=A0ABT3L3X4_9CYAN|nr:response regulator [Spirulina subsalsa]MCW6036203.1 response regulator [Spirulina subsalsa FACHB-351]
MTKPIILCVDDEAVVLNSLKIQLKSAFQDRYLYEMAESANEALEIIEEYRSDGVDVIVIVSDWLMPGIKGDEFLIQVHEKYPKVVKILLTGQADQSAIERACEQAELHSYLAKPWNSEDLITAIQSGLSTRDN